MVGRSCAGGRGSWRHDRTKMTVTITAVRTSADLESFTAFPYALYRNDSCWVAPLVRDERSRLRRDRHPFFAHGDAEFFLARRHGEVVGRIAAIRNDLHLATHNDGAGFFGFFESVDDNHVAEQLLDSAECWLACQGLALMRGPMSYSINEDFGLLVAGFDRRPAVRCGHHQPYYRQLLESSGFRTAATLLSYEASADRHSFPQHWTRGIDLARRALNIQTRSFDRRHLERDAESIRRLYQQSFEQNWGFVPLTSLEMKHLCREISRFGDPQLIRFATIDGADVACIVALPDWNMALQHLAGKLLPFGWAKLWYHAKRINRLRIMLMGIVPQYRRQGVDMILYDDLYRLAAARGYVSSEAARVLENNQSMRRTLEKAGAEITRTYRVYERTIGGSPRTNIHERARSPIPQNGKELLASAGCDA